MKNRFSKWIRMMFALILMPFCVSCVGNKEQDNYKMKIIATIFPEYDWVMNVIGEEKDNIKVDLLLDNGIDLHSYQPTTKDIVNIAKCDLFIYVGGESDDWVDRALKQSKNKNLISINLMEVLGDAKLEEELSEGMEGEEEEEEEEEEEIEYDEHVWLSIRNSKIFVNKIGDSIAKLDEEKASYYKANAKAYCDKLDNLDSLYTAAVAEGNQKTLVFADRYPFRYMVHDYGLTAYGAFLGCSAETEAKFSTITFLANKVDELGLKALLVIDGSDGKIATNVRNATKNKDQKILMMHSVQSSTTKDYNDGWDYLAYMEKNLETLKVAME